MVWYHSICENRPLGRVWVGTHELTRHCQSWSTCTTHDSLFSFQLAMSGTWDKIACSMEGGRRSSARGQGRDVTRSCLVQTSLVNPTIFV